MNVKLLTAWQPVLESCKVKGAGHMIPFDDFAGFFAALDDFLAG